MHRRHQPYLVWFRVVASFVAVMILASSAFARSIARIMTLPPPRTTGGRPLMDVLADRRTTREFTAAPIQRQTLSDLLWAAAGINRREAGKRTAPSARNQQAIDVYVAREDGLWLYLPKHHALRKVTDADIRAATGMQDFVARVPLNLVYVLDETRLTTDAAQADMYAGADTAFMAQNVYLFCASEGLGVVVRGAVDKAALASAMGLPPRQRVILCQSVGHPASVVDVKPGTIELKD